MSINFFQTVMGSRFYDGTMPRIAESLERIADALEGPQVTDLNYTRACDMAEALVEALASGDKSKAADLIKKMNKLK